MAFISVSSIGFAPEAGFNVSGIFTHGSAIRITGSGFGSKPQAAPIIWDMGAEVFIDGVEDTAHAALNDGDNAIGPIYASGFEAIMSLNRSQRHANVDRHYFASDFHGRSFLTLDALSQFDGTNSSRQSFSSFKIRFPYDPHRVDGVNFTNLSGSFTEGVDGELGEAITITYNLDDFAGNILNVGLGPSGYLSTQLGVYSTALNISSATTPFTIVGDVSGATADCETSSPFRSSAPGKLWRINQKANDGMLLIAQFGIEQFWIESNLSGVDEINMNRSTNRIDLTDVTSFPGWIHVECLSDFRTGTAMVGAWRAAGDLSSVIKTSAAQDGDANLLNQWLEIHRFGFDAGVEHAMAVDYGELYVDSTPQRLVIGDVNVYANCKELEMQRLTGWVDGQIDAIVNRGAFANVAGKSLYFLDLENSATLLGQFN